MECINIRGINRKFNHLKNFLAQDKISILAISETHTVKSIVVPKFHCYQRNSEINPTRSGSVALLVAQNLASIPHTIPNHLNHLEAVAANLHLQNMSILIISYYNRPQDRVSADLLRYAAQHNFAIVLGDFNARHTEFGDTQTNPNGRSLNSLIITLPLYRLHNTDPTFLSHTGCSISDHILSTENFVPFLYPHCSIGTTVTSDHVPLKTHLLLVEVLPDEVEAHIRQLKSKMAPGPDELKAPIFKNLPRIAIVALTVIFNNCMRAHHFPPAWKHPTTVMIPKPGKDPTNPLSYRPISLLNIAGKVFEKILSTRLKNFLEINNLLPPEQFGYRSERSTINPILEFHTDTTRHANLKEHTLAVFLDIERAFDRVWHDGLVQKLIKIPINPNFIQLIDSFLSNRTCSVKIKNIKSRPIAHQAGVPQGSILSPLLYIVYCRDFPVTDAPRTKTRLFADDTAVWTSQRNPAIAARILQGHLNNITTWTNTWRIKLNPLKSQSILMSYSGARSRHQAPHLLLNNQAIPKLQHIRYLGVTFSKNCTLNEDVKETLKKSRNRANLLYRIRGRIRGCDSKTLYHTYKSYIRPVIEYRAPIYATLYPALLHQISACERRMLRRIFRLPDRFPSENLHQETNTIPIQSRLKELQSRYATRTLNSNNALAIQTLSTSFKYPSRDGRLLNRIPKIPKRKLKHSPTALLSPAYTDLPDDLQELVDSTPLTMR
jgi:hypothetical protein